MTTIRTQINVTKCSECPFYSRTVVSALADLFLKRDASIRTGTCRFNAFKKEVHVGRVSLPISLGWSHVPDEDRIPEACPLRGSACEIEVKPS